jgi:ankyrin repeat protein
MGPTKMTDKSAKAIWTQSAKLFVFAAAVAMLTPSAHAQFSDSYNFLKAVKEREGAKATELIDEPGKGGVIINTRDDVTGETALHIVVKRRDPAWIGFLLQKGANPNVVDKQNVTPLILATQLGFAEGAEWLIKYKANVNQANRSGETPLILATQLRNPEMVRLLLNNGANADKTDSVAGLSARDYAARDGRGNNILNIIENYGKAAATPAEKPKDLDFSGVGDAK